MLVYHSKKYKGIVVRRYILSCVPSVLLLANSLLNPVTNFAGFEKQITKSKSQIDQVTSWLLEVNPGTCLNSSHVQPWAPALGWPAPPNIKNWKCFSKLPKECAYLQVDWRLWRHRGPFPQPRCCVLPGTQEEPAALTYAWKCRE